MSRNLPVPVQNISNNFAWLYILNRGDSLKIGVAITNVNDRSKKLFTLAHTFDCEIVGFYPGSVKRIKELESETLQYFKNYLYTENQYWENVIHSNQLEELIYFVDLRYKRKVNKL